MKISMIAAMGDKHEIGLHNELLWHMPADMKHFRETTMGKPIIVGRKTYESFGAKPLPGRQNIVITRDPNYQGNGAEVVDSIDAAFKAVGNIEEVMVIGGASFYEQALPMADRLYLTYVHSEFEADAWFPQFDKTEWVETSCEDHKADENNPYDYTFLILDRK